MLKLQDRKSVGSIASAEPSTVMPPDGDKPLSECNTKVDAATGESQEQGPGIVHIFIDRLARLSAAGSPVTLANRIFEHKTMSPDLESAKLNPNQLYSSTAIIRTGTASNVVMNCSTISFRLSSSKTLFCQNAEPLPRVGRPVQSIQVKVIHKRRR
jgi:hypothetical protein